MFRTAALAALLCTSSALGLIHGVDSSDLVPVPTFTKARGQGFTKAVIRGYQTACNAGGQVDPNFIPTYKNAAAAGYSNIDVYWSPCTGSTNKCKSFAAQIAELRNAIAANSVHIGRVWVDIEKDSICNTWDSDATANQDNAKAMMAEVRGSGLPVGIYSSAQQWTAIFGSSNFALAPDVPVWFAKYDNVENLALSVPFGGWQGSAFGHQYTDKSPSGLFRLSVFAE